MGSILVYIRYCTKTGSVNTTKHSLRAMLTSVNQPINTNTEENEMSENKRLWLVSTVTVDLQGYISLNQYHYDNETSARDQLGAFQGRHTINETHVPSYMETISGNWMAKNPEFKSDATFGGGDAEKPVNEYLIVG